MGDARVKAELLSGVDLAPVDALKALKQEADQLKSRRASMEALKGDFAEPVYRRVDADYARQLESIEKKAEPLRQQAMAAYAGLRNALREIEADKQANATLLRLAEADTQRRAFVATVKDWAARLIRIESFGQPTSELADETIFAFRLSEPRGACVGDHCRKLLQLSYPVPGERELVERAAVMEVQLELEAGLLSATRAIVEGTAVDIARDVDHPDIARATRVAKDIWKNVD